jgi:chemotaxis response regulator CheB
MRQTTQFVLALGMSTSGTQALEVVLVVLSRVCPGIVIVQHLPEKFTAEFALHLDGLCWIEVKEARNNDRVVARAGSPSGCVLRAGAGRDRRSIHRTAAEAWPASSHCL